MINGRRILTITSSRRSETQRTPSRDGLLVLLEEVLADSRWMEDANCLGLPTELFFPEQPGRGGHYDWETPKAVCNRCDVQVECLNYARKYRIRYGMWGGWSEDQRKRSNWSPSRKRSLAKQLQEEVFEECGEENLPHTNQPNGQESE